nr:GNAT family N-acetyltransferase [Jiella flava]
MSGREVHDLLRLRMDVFVVEQACAFAEIDGKDIDALHLRQFSGETLIGCLRVLSPEGEPVRIGRIVTAKDFRSQGLGHEMLVEALRYVADRFAEREVVLSAQAQLQGFYAQHGFEPASAPYDEDGIAHIDMKRPAPRH